MANYDPLTLDMLQANVELLAENERLDLERRRLVELDEFKRDFLARLSHDLRTPLNSIIGFSDLISSEVGGKVNKKHAEFVAAINRNGHALLSMINELLELSGLESGHTRMYFESVPLETILADVRAAVDPVLMQAGITAAWPDPAAVREKRAVVDRRHMMQVMVNLIDNARKFTPAGGKITIEMDGDDHHSHFVVADTGPGIPAHERDRVFMPYYQRPNSSTANVQGIGLGLAIVRRIVNYHHGSISLDSDIGKGCRFTIDIPHQHPDLYSEEGNANERAT